MECRSESPASGGRQAFQNLAQAVSSVTEASAARFENQLHENRAIAAELNSLAPVLDEARATPPATGARASRHLRLLKRAKALLVGLAEFASEHEALLEPATRPAIEAFTAWLPERVETLRAERKAFNVELAASLQEHRQESSELCELWSVCDADGLASLDADEN